MVSTVFSKSESLLSYLLLSKCSKERRVDVCATNGIGGFGKYSIEMSNMVTSSNSQKGQRRSVIRPQPHHRLVTVMRHDQISL